MQDIQALLGKMGLNHHESTLYLHLLQSGELPASKVAAQTKIPRSTTRGILDKLCERGLLAKIYKRNTQFYHCKAPGHLVQFVENSIIQSKNILEQLQGILPVLTSLYGQKGIMPKVQFFEGEEQVIEAFNHSLYVPELQEILSITNYNFLDSEKIQQNDDDFYIPMRVKKGISLRVLCKKNKRSLKSRKHSVQQLRQHRYFPGDFSFPGNMFIYGDFLLLYAANDGEYVAVLIQSAVFSETMRVLFEFMWGMSPTLP